ncbi:XTP/dITP diphosphatase [Ruminococcus sp.]
MNRIVIASNNAGKLREIRDILQPLGFTVVSQREAGISIEVEENGETFAENAALKARAVYEALHCPVIADDSGLLVDALDGAPGVHSHRFAGEGATDADRNAKLLELLDGVPAEKRTARFECVLCYVDAAGETHFFSGTCEGRIGTVPAGENGFGYDPLFCVGDRTMAQMTEEEKNQVSHRANALAELARYFQEK